MIILGVTRHQLELEHMRHDCKKRYHGTQTGLCTFCGKVIRLDLRARHVTTSIWNSLSYGYVQSHGVLYGRARRRTALIIFVWPMRCPLWSRRLTWDVGSHHGQFPGISGTKPYDPLFLEYQRMYFYSASVACHWYIVIGCSVERACISPI